jgi:phage baseplate assembly protein gpV
MDNVIGLLKLQSERVRNSIAHARIGIVTSSDPVKGVAKVLLQPEGILTGWLPVLTQWAGAGWGITCPPTPGNQVLIIPLEGQPDSGIVIGCLFSASARPPMAGVGELVIQHQSGTSLCLNNLGQVFITGDLHVTGNVFDAKGALEKLRTDFNSHVHSPGSDGTTSPPTPQD